MAKLIVVDDQLYEFESPAEENLSKIFTELQLASLKCTLHRYKVEMCNLEVAPNDYTALMQRAQSQGAIRAIMDLITTHETAIQNLEGE